MDNNNKNEVNSWDLFDTLIARLVPQPDYIFNIVSDKIKLPEFKKLRIIAEKINGSSLDNIYKEFQKLTLMSDEKIKEIKNIEFETELEYIVPITCNCLQVKNGDIIISDMYLSKEQLTILIQKNINKELFVFVSSGGKKNGTIWEVVKKQFNIIKHIGDNIHSDINMPKNYGIKTEHTIASLLHPLEDYLFKNYFEFAKCIRKLKMKNPYQEKTIEHELYNDQVLINIPLLLKFSYDIIELHKISNFDKILFTTRDCCLLEKLFLKISKNINIIHFHCSRMMFYCPSKDYIKYVKNIITKNSLIIDIQGTYSSGSYFFSTNFGFTPRCHMLTGIGINDKLTYSFKYISDILERINLCNEGTLIYYQGNKDIRAPTEHNPKFVDVIQKTFSTFLDEFDFTITFDYTKDFWQKYADSCVKHINSNKYIHVDLHASLTDLASKYKIDKYGHNYTTIYQIIIDKYLPLSKPLYLLEINQNILSLKIWNEYLYGNIEIYTSNPEYIKLTNKGNIHIMDDVDLKKYENIFDIVIDNGSQQQISLLRFWNYLKSKGTYIIENLHTEEATETFQFMLKWKTELQEKIKEEIQSIDFYPSSSTSEKFIKERLKFALCVITKK
jgi:hypothetical protein